MKEGFTSSHDNQGRRMTPVCFSVIQPQRPYRSAGRRGGWLRKSRHCFFPSIYHPSEQLHSTTATRYVITHKAGGADTPAGFDRIWELEGKGVPMLKLEWDERALIFGGHLKAEARPSLTIRRTSLLRY
jgi:hypothetical protein